MRIAITGASGRLGSYVLRALADHELRVVDLAAPDGLQVDFRMADLRAFDALHAALQGIEVVVHLGGKRTPVPAMLRLRHAGSFFSFYDVLPYRTCGR